MYITIRSHPLKPPVFEDIGEFFKIILYRPKGVSSEGGVPRNVTTNVPRNVTTNDQKELNKTQLAILELVKKDRSITISEIASILNLADRTIMMCSWSRRLQAPGPADQPGPSQRLVSEGP